MRVLLWWCFSPFLSAVAALACVGGSPDCYANDAVLAMLIVMTGDNMTAKVGRTGI